MKLGRNQERVSWLIEILVSDRCFSVAIAELLEAKVKPTTGRLLDSLAFALPGLDRPVQDFRQPAQVLVFLPSLAGALPLLDHHAGVPVAATVGKGLIF